MQPDIRETIAAVSTALSDAGIGIVRVSGADAVAAVGRFYRNKAGAQDLKSHGANTIRFGRFCDETGSVLDEVLVSVMRAPHTYTGEDVVEINCHGGMRVVQTVLQTVLTDDRVRIAEPGEFTKRAFLNGRMDLTEAEAVMDVIRAESDFAMHNAMGQLSGALRERVSKMREPLIRETAFIEAALDDPENYDLTGFPEQLGKKLSMLISECDTLISSMKEGQIRKEGIRTAIIGKPNAGKSSLFNRLVQRERAIVTEIAGTTRDALEETVLLSDIPLRLIDTAGIRETTDAIERIGVERARAAAAEAELVLYVADRTQPFDRTDADMITGVIDGKKLIVLLNKSDLAAQTVTGPEDIACFLREQCGIPASCQPGEAPEYAEIVVSAGGTTMTIPAIATVMGKNELSDNSISDGMDALKAAVAQLFLDGRLQPRAETFLTNARQRDAFVQARESLLLVQESILNGVSEDFFVPDLMNAYAALGSVIGEDVGEDLIDRIFSEFCMGK